MRKIITFLMGNSCTCEKKGRGVELHQNIRSINISRNYVARITLLTVDQYYRKSIVMKLRICTHRHAYSQVESHLKNGLSLYNSHHLLRVLIVGAKDSYKQVASAPLFPRSREHLRC